MNDKNVVQPISVTKPVTLIRDDFMNNLVELCNNSGLPFFIIESVLKDFIQEVHVASQKQLEADRVQYEKALNEAKAQFVSK